MLTQQQKKIDFLNSSSSSSSTHNCNDHSHDHSTIHRSHVSTLGINIDHDTDNIDPIDIDTFEGWLGQLVWANVDQYQQDSDDDSASSQHHTSLDDTPEIYRVKGSIYASDDTTTKYALQGVHDIFEVIPSGVPWQKDEKKMTKLVIIGRHLDHQKIQQSFHKDVITNS